jgi:hypothetical protein
MVLVGIAAGAAPTTRPFHIVTFNGTGRRHGIRCRNLVEQDVRSRLSLCTWIHFVELTCLITSLNLRVFSDESDKAWKASVKDIQGDILCVSQFTLLASTTKGNKPQFYQAMVLFFFFVNNLFISLWSFVLVIIAGD